VPTYGYYPVIIDFGFSYAKNFETLPCWAPMSYTQYGFTTHKYEPIADAKLFLTTISRELRVYYRGDNDVNSLTKKTDEIFSCLNINKNRGWDNPGLGNNKVLSFSQEVFLFLEPVFKASKIFENNIVFGIETLQVLVTLPLGGGDVEHNEEYTRQKVGENLQTFMREWTKIETIT
jgi:hypothetical protein